MFDSIVQDVKQQFSYGNAIVRLIIVNTAVFILLMVVFAMIGLFGGSNYGAIQEVVRSYISLNSDFLTNLKRPWVLITHMFAHYQLFHFVMNMLVLYWFGRIFGDLLGDRRVVPLYLMGGLVGALFYLIGVNFIYISPGTLVGASGSILAIVVAAAIVAPDYGVNMILIGRVPLKYIALAYIVMDFAGLASLSNVGGHFAHFGGMLMGWLYIYLVRNGNDPADSVNQFFDWIKGFFEKNKKPKSNLKVSYKSQNVSKTKKVKRQSVGKQSSDTVGDHQKKLDSILDKISKSGIESLTKEERDFLDKASNNS